MQKICDSNTFSQNKNTIGILKIKILSHPQFHLKNFSHVLISHDIVEAIQPLTTLKRELTSHNNSMDQRVNKDKIQLIDETIQQLRANKSGSLSIAEHQQSGGLSVTDDHSGGLSINNK